MRPELPRLPLTRRALLAAGVALLAGCTAQGEGPVPLLVGADTCDFCRMTILDDRLAAEYLSRDRVLRFDELGCLRDWVLAHDPGRTGRAFVRDHAGAGWVPAEAAILVAGAVRTPMSTNLVAFASEAPARALLEARGGRRLAYAEILGPEAAAGRRYALAAPATGQGPGGRHHE